MSDGSVAYIACDCIEMIITNIIFYQDACSALRLYLILIYFEIRWALRSLIIKLYECKHNVRPELLVEIFIFS